MPDVKSSGYQHFDLYLRDTEQQIIVNASLLNNLAMTEILEMILDKAFIVQTEVNKLMQDRALVG